MGDELVTKPPRKPGKLRATIVSWTQTIIIALVLAFLISQFVIVNAAVVSGSMENTIMTGDRVICNRLSYLFRPPQRFDVIAFDYHEGGQSWIYVKRIIGLPGERLEIIGGLVYIDDATTPLYEGFVFEQLIGDFGPFYIPDEHYFVLGDNRNSSYDSKDWPDPFLPAEQILGRAILVYHPRLELVS